MEIIYATVTKVWPYDLTLGFSAFWKSLQFTYFPKISEAQFIFFDQQFHFIFSFELESHFSHLQILPWWVVLLANETESRITWKMDL